MKAMERIDDPRLFVNENDTSAPAAAHAVSQQPANLLSKFKTT